MDDTKDERDIRSIFRFEYRFNSMWFIGIYREIPAANIATIKERMNFIVNIEISSMLKYL